MARKSTKSSNSHSSRKSSKSKSAKFIPASTARFCEQYRDYTGLQVVHPHAAGIDIGGRLSHFVALEIAPETLEVTEFGCDTPDLKLLCEYLVKYGVTTVALESTGVYWVPIYEILEEANIEVCLVNPSHVKNVPGRRKDDKLDCRWLLTLHTFGLLSASFRPGKDILPLRNIWRHRQLWIKEQADEIKRMQKHLDTMNLRLHKVMTDIVGVTGRAIIEAIIKGEHDPKVLATFRDPRCKCTDEELERALTGHYKPDVIFLLKQCYHHFLYLHEQIVECDQKIEPFLISLIPLGDDNIAKQVNAAGLKRRQTATEIRKHLPDYNLQKYLELLLNGDATSLPGIGPLLLMDIITEVGIDMSKWPTEKHFASYVTCAPKHQISGGKILSNRTQKSNMRVAVAFRQAAAAVSRTDTANGAFYRRLALRIGSGKAMIATARKIACQFYGFLRYGKEYTDIGAEEYEKKYHEYQVRALEKKAAKLGLQVIAIAS